MTTPSSTTTAVGSAPVRTLSITSFVLGLSSLVFGWTFIAPIAGLVVGLIALAREPLGKTFAVWGVVLSSIMLVGVVFAVLIAVAGVGFSFIFFPFVFLF
jgi:hypothetical protein